MKYELELVARHLATPHQSLKEFCVQENLLVDNFYYWITKYKQLGLQLHTQIAPPGIAPSGFSPLEISAPPQTVSLIGDMSLTYPNGVVLCLESVPDLSVLADLIKAYR